MAISLKKVQTRAVVITELWVFIIKEDGNLQALLYSLSEAKFNRIWGYSLESWAVYIGRVYIGRVYIGRVYIGRVYIGRECLGRYNGSVIATKGKQTSSGNSFQEYSFSARGRRVIRKGVKNTTLALALCSLPVRGAIWT